MFEQLYESLHEHVTLSDSEWEMCRSRFVPRRLKKRQFVLQEGEVSRSLVFIEQGAMVSYSTDDKGGQNVIRFGFEGWWIGDLYSYLTGEPSSLNVEALEECRLLIIGREANETLMDEIPAYSKYHRILFQNAYVAFLRRVENTVGLPAEEKYTRFLESYPTACMNRVPQHMIASWMGMTPETLSRVRRQRSDSGS